MEQALEVARRDRGMNETNTSLSSSEACLLLHSMSGSCRILCAHLLKLFFCRDHRGGSPSSSPVPSPHPMEIVQASPASSPASSLMSPALTPTPNISPAVTPILSPVSSPRRAQSGSASPTLRRASRSSSRRSSSSSSASSRGLSRGSSRGSSGPTSRAPSLVSLAPGQAACQFCQLPIGARHDCAFKVLDEMLNKVVPPCLLYTSPSPRDGLLSRMPSSA